VALKRRWNGADAIDQPLCPAIAVGGEDVAERVEHRSGDEAGAALGRLRRGTAPRDSSR
jgi:hypothetical protein